MKGGLVPRKYKYKYKYFAHSGWVVLLSGKYKTEQVGNLASCTFYTTFD